MFIFEFNDYVLHPLYGVGRIISFEHMKINNVLQDFIKMQYKDCDIYIPSARISVLKFYAGKNQNIVIDNAGKSTKLKKQQQIKEKILQNSQELIAQIVQRNNVKRQPFLVPDSYSDFVKNKKFELTEDQQSAIDDCINDAKQEKLIDRLICGDVGFGKTEVAMHLIFIISFYAKVLFIVPTKILAYQHYETIKKRFDGFGKNIQILSDANRQDWLDGKIDILIATISHKYINNILFDKIGLVVLDEEQHFGAKIKESIRSVYNFIQLSATPIPRTLSFALYKIKDISIIKTPPLFKKNIKLELIKFNKQLVNDLIKKTIKDEGKIFLIVPKIEMIQEIADIIDDEHIELHGKLTAEEMQKNLSKFESGEIKVLIATNIVESGINITNANLMIVFYANLFGISQLYQLKGRLARNGNDGHFVLILPTVLKDYIKQKFDILEEYSNLGDNLQLSMQDMDIRGIGTALGLKQSGKFELGIEFYFETIHEAIYGEKKDRNKELMNQSSIKLDGVFFENNELKLMFYQKFSKIQSVEELMELKDNMQECINQSLLNVFDQKLSELKSIKTI